MELYMVRHGQTDFNKNKRLQGVIDIPLNEYGIELAEKTAEGLKDVPFDVIYSSPLSRAFQTAEIIRGDRPVEIIPTDSLLELSFGEYEGLICKGEHYNLPDPDFMKFFDNMEKFAKEEAGANGLAWVKVDKENGYTGGIAKFITDDIKEGLEKEYNVKVNDAIFFIADELKTAQKIAGLVRIELGKRLDLIEKNVYKFCFITDFPMYELSDEGTIDFNHNPFSMPQGGREALENKDPLEILAYQYDVVCNGYEMASGAVRNHDPELMVKAFEIAGYSEKEVETKFGALYNAFQYGTPPHAGAAPGLDRMVMLIADSNNIREVIAFPKNKKARDLLMRAPSKVTEKQLEDVHIKVDVED